MIKRVLILLSFIPFFAIAQQEKYEKCNDKNRKENELPCKIIERYSSNIISDESMLIQYVDILLSKRYLLDPEKCKPYKISSISGNKIWNVIVKSYNCKYCYIHINVNKNTGEILNFYKSEDLEKNN